MSSLLLLARKSWGEFGKDNASQMAAAITYYVLFAIVPLTMFLVSMVQVVVPDESQDDVTESIEAFLNVNPEDVSIVLADDAKSTIEAQSGTEVLATVERELAAMSESDERAEELAVLADMADGQEPITIAGYQLDPGDLEVRSESLISDTVEGAARATVPLGVVGFVLLALSATIAFSAIRRSLNFIWKVPHRPLAQQRIMELSMLIGLVVLLGASVAATTITQLIRELNEGTQNPISESGVLWLAFGYLLPWALTFALVLLAYRFVPNAPTSFRDVCLGAFLASLAIETLKYGYSVYVVNFSSYGAPAYGALTGVLLFMFFIWLASYTFLLGAELASEYPKVMRAAPSIDDSGPAETRSLPGTIIAAIRGLFVAK